jgi:hypothetical protein
VNLRRVLRRHVRIRSAAQRGLGAIDGAQPVDGGIALLVFGTIVLMFWMLFWLCDRYPRTMLVMPGFWRGLTGR